MAKKNPNIVLILADNLGWGELGCYGGGVLRGAPTPRIDALGLQGLRFLNFNVESDCVPTRSALMTGRQAIRTGAFQSVPAGLPQGLTKWEVLLPEVLSAQGYATAHYGKWHLGDIEGRFPNDRGFDEWYGLPRTTNESLFTTSHGYDSDIVGLPYVMEGKKGGKSSNVKVFDNDERRLIDGELVDRTIDFMKKQTAAKTPFFAYVPITQLHFPNLAHPDFMGVTGHGEMADSLAEMDHRVGQIVDAVDALGIAEDTILMFGSDNGPEFRRPWRGTAGYWRSTYHTAMEGSLRVPFMMRWPGQIPEGGVSDEIVHIADLFPTLLGLIGADLPADRPLDGVDQLDFFLGKQEKSNREGFVYYIKDELRAVKWREWKVHLVWEPEVNDGAIKLEAPYLFNLIQDPKEETNVMVENGWVRSVAMRMVHEFRQSLKENPPIPPGAPDPYTPPGK
ncbi:MAG: arylsulfatase [Alphaproteobacteria bacterium]|nr:arylsulfatase [Alphaproteobacteria bacterium]